MHYFLAFQILCGGFCAFVAADKGRRPIPWGLAGALLPVFGVTWCLLARPVGTDGEVKPRPQQPAETRRPKRCCGQFVPDCLGCPHFRRQLFQEDSPSESRGYCAHFDRPLVDERRPTRSA